MTNKRTELEVFTTYLPKDEAAKVERRMKKQKISKRSQYLRGLILADIGVEGDEIKAGRPKNPEET